MKKSLLLIASAALLLAGCAKEKLGPDAGSGEMVNVTISAQVQGDELTKAAIDNDGNGVNANRCIMVLYYGDQVYGRYQDTVSGYHATFDVKVPAKRTYKAVFWADCAAEDGGDLYYNTADLKNITLKSAYVGNNDKRDAFFVCEDYTVDVQTNKSFTATLKRPFAQINVISNDIQYLHLPTLYPQKVNLSFSAPVSFNAMSGECGDAAVITYETDVYKAYDASKQQLTLSMDYLFAGSRAAVDIEFKAPTEGTMKVEYSFTNIPYERNYRTNIIGNLLTADASWEVTIAPSWKEPDYDVPYYEASSIEDAQEYIAEAGDQKSKAVDLTNATITEDDVEDDGTIHFILTKQSPEDMMNFTLPAIPESIEGCSGWTITYDDEKYPTKNVNVTAPQGTTVTIEAPNSHVTLNGEEYEQVTATTSQSTLVVPAGVTVKTLIVKEGAVEIHGVVNNLTVSPAEGKTVVFRACEGLSAGVFEKIYKEGTTTNYLDPMYTFELVGEKYNIYKLPVVAMIGTVEYPSLAAALAAVQANETIEVVAESVELPAISKADITLKGNGATKVTKFGGLTGKNVTLDGFEFTVQINPNAENFAIKNSKFTGNNGLRYAYAKGNVLIENCVFDTQTYGIHFDGTQPGKATVKGCQIVGFNTFNPELNFIDCNFVDSDKNQYYVAQSWSNVSFTNCTFSEKWCAVTDYQTIGIASGNGVATLNGCTTAIGTVVDACMNSAMTGVVAIDATGNATDGFTAGTFITGDAANIKVAGLNEAVAVEGKTNVYTIAPKQFAETTVAYCNGVEYQTLQAAFNAVPDGVETTVTLVADATTATLGDKDHIGAKTVILNLNGHNITGYVRGISTLTNSASLDGATLVNYANLTINGEGTIGDLEGQYHHNALVNMSNGTNLTINGGTFVAKSCCVYHYSASSEANNATLNINGGNFKAYENAATDKYVFGIGGKPGQTLTFNYGNAIAEASVEGAKGIYCSLAGTTINVHSGSITANINAIYLSMGKNVTINIDGGKLETLDSEGHANNYMSTGSYAGSSLPIYASAFGSENIVCNISGGTFVYPYYSWQLSGTKPATWERVINAGVGITSSVANANITASLTGGTYSTNQMLSDITNTQSAASGIVAEGYTCIQNDNGTWTVVAEN